MYYMYIVGLCVHLCVFVIRYIMSVMVLYDVFFVF